MTTNDSHAWWSRLRHQGLLLSPVVMLERYPDAPEPAPFHKTARLRDAFTRFVSAQESAAPERVTLSWVDALLEDYLGHQQGRLARQQSIPPKLRHDLRIGTRVETVRPHRVVFADPEGKTPALLVMADASPQVGRGRGRTAYARFLELLRGTGQRLGLLTNGRQFRLVYAGLDFESWCEWESDRWFDDGEGGEELAGLRLLLSPEGLTPAREGLSGLLDAVEESRKRQADLSSVLRENVRQAIEVVLEEVSSASRTNPNLLASLVQPPPRQDAADPPEPLSDAEAHEALLQATVRVVMRLVVCLFAESRQLLPVNDPVYAGSYGVRPLYEVLEEAIRNEGGTRVLRETLLTRGRIELIYAFQNEKRVFSAAHHSFKQVALFATKGGTTRGFLTRFRMGVGDSPHAHELPDDILKRDHAAMCFTPEDVRRNSPKTLSLVELRSERDLAIFRTIYANSIRIGDKAPGWEITYATEFHMTNDSKYFPPLEKWEANGFRPDVFGRWIGPGDDVALPLCQGGMIHNLDSFYNGWEQNRWVGLPADAKQPKPKFLMGESDYAELSDTAHRWRLAYRRIARTTDTRTFICSFLWPLPCGDSVFLLLPADQSLEKNLGLSAMLASLVFDWVIRQRLSGTNLSWFVMEECPFPRTQTSDIRFGRLAITAARLTFIHRRFSPEWMQLRSLYPALASREWKHWWSVTEADRLRLRVEIDALAADLYGLSPEDLDWIVRDDPTDPKGFYRVDRQLPFRERLTGLAAAAFRALKAGKWSADSAATLSNDEFFAAIGIPELTAGDEPLIRKREGCHRWKPEEFGPDDPRHGWTWDHCRADAVALLGSEDAVREYVEGKKERAEPGPQHGGPKDLFGEPLPPRQGRLF